MPLASNTSHTRRSRRSAPPAGVMRRSCPLGRSGLSQLAACSERLEHQSANAASTKIISLRKPYRPTGEAALACGLSDDDQTVRLDRPNSSTCFDKIEELPKKLHRPGRSASKESDDLDEP